MREPDYQAYLIKKLHDLFPGCMVIKNDSSYIQGIPDLVIFYFDRYGFLEVKISEDAPSQPNQDHYVELFNQMSFAAYIHPENERYVLEELARALGRD